MSSPQDNDRIHPNTLAVFAAAYPQTIYGKVDAMLRGRQQLKDKRSEVVRHLMVGIAKRQIIDSVLFGDYNNIFAKLCRAGQLIQLEAVDGVPGWDVISTGLQWGLLSAFAQLESNARQQGWEAAIDVCRYVDAESNGTAFAWYVRSRWSPGSEWLGMHVAVRADTLVVDELRVFPADFVLEPDPFRPEEQPN